MVVEPFGSCVRPLETKQNLGVSKLQTTKEVCEEIERIVSLKHKKILQNIEETRNFKNKKEELFIKIKNNSILNEGINYGLEYWQKFVKQAKRQK